MPEINSKYFRDYRTKLGFSNQSSVKDFFGAKDITPLVDYNYISVLNSRLSSIVDKINLVVCDEVKVRDLNAFKEGFINSPYEKMKSNEILPKLNNQGRRPEQVYFSWMRGYIISNFFINSLGHIFGVDTAKINLIGDDDFRNIETFKRTPKADLEIKLGESVIRIEMQSGFTGINDIKQHKVLEAKQVFSEYGYETLALHFDVYNGQVAFLKISQIEESDMNWITRQQMEGQTVFNIDQNFFKWKLTDLPPKYSEIKFD